MVRSSSTTRTLFAVTPPPQPRPASCVAGARPARPREPPTCPAPSSLLSSRAGAGMALWTTCEDRLPVDNSGDKSVCLWINCGSTRGKADSAGPVVLGGPDELVLQLPGVPPADRQ